MLHTPLLNRGKTIATTVIPDKIYTKVSIPKRAESGAAIASPIGLNIIVPIASKDETLDSDSLGTLRCSAVLQSVPHKSKVIPNKNAHNAINNKLCGFANDQIYKVTVNEESIKNLIGYLGFTFIAIKEPTIKPADSAVITNDQDLAPLKCSSAIKGPNTFSAAAQHMTINENAKTIIAIQLKERNTRQP
jgi:hypothetical protein